MWRVGAGLAAVTEYGFHFSLFHSSVSLQTVTPPLTCFAAVKHMLTYKT